MELKYVYKSFSFHRNQLIFWNCMVDCSKLFYLCMVSNEGRKEKNWKEKEKPRHLHLSDIYGKKKSNVYLYNFF